MQESRPTGGSPSRLISQPLERALYLADDDVEGRRHLESHGWHVRHSREFARTAEMYRSYIRARE